MSIDWDKRQGVLGKHKHLASDVLDSTSGDSLDLENTVTMLYRSVTVLTHDDILALPGSFHEIVPAPGPGKALDILRISLLSDIEVAYTSIGSSSYWAVNIGEDPGIDLGLYLNENTEGSVDSVSGVLVGDGYVSSGPGMAIDSIIGVLQPSVALDPVDVDNKGAYLRLLSSPGLAGGDAANLLRVAVLYTINQIG